MASGIIRLRRRQSGNPGAPTTMQPGELAVNEVDGIVYYGRGVNSSNPDLASTIVNIAGAAKQDTNINLSALSGLNGIADRVPYFTGVGSLALASLTPFARTILDDADAAAGRATLGLGTASLLTSTTSTLDSTTGRAMRVADFGIGVTTGTVSTFTVVSDWAKPAGWKGFVNATGSVNTPDGITGTYFVYEVNGRRDAGGGYVGTAYRYDTGESWVGYSLLNTTAPTWIKRPSSVEVANTPGKTPTVTNIAALKALDKTVKTAAFVLSYSTANDGGGGQYYYDSTDTSSSDNGGTIIVATDGGRWKLKHDGRIAITQFGANTASSDNTTAIQNCINFIGSYGGGEVFVPSGTFNITSALNNTNNGVYIRGVSRFASLIRQTTASANIINNSGSFFKLSDLSTIYSTTPTAGVAIASSGANSHFDNFLIRNAWYGMELYGAGTGQKVTNFEILEYEQAGIYAHDVNDIFVFNFIMNAGNATRGRLGGIRLYNRVEAFVAISGDILFGVYSQTTDADNNSLNARPAYNTFNSMFYDSAVNGVVMDKTAENEFIGCWFSGGRSGSGNPGIRLAAAYSTKFIGGRFFNNGGHGLSISGSASGTMLTAGWTAESNSVTAGDGTAHGVFLESGATEVIINAGRAHNGLYTGKQGYGIFISTGCSKLNISSNDLTGNLTANTVGGDLTGVDVRVSGNIGCITSTRGTATIPSGQTAVTVTHGLSYTPTLADIDITCGTAPGTAGISSWYITSITATTFQIVVNAAATANVSFGWRARLYGE